MEMANIVKRQPTEQKTGFGSYTMQREIISKITKSEIYLPYAKNKDATKTWAAKHIRHISEVQIA